MDSRAAAVQQENCRIKEGPEELWAELVLPAQLARSGDSIVPVKQIQMQQYFRNSASVQSMKGLLDSGQSLFCQRSSPAVVTASYLHACAAAVENNASD
jgi:hypothetical protein